MTLKIQLCITRINFNFKTYSNRKQFFEIYIFLLYFWSNNVALVIMKDLLSPTLWMQYILFTATKCLKQTSCKDFNEIKRINKNAVTSTLSEVFTIAVWSLVNKFSGNTLSSLSSFKCLNPHTLPMHSITQQATDHVSHHTPGHVKSYTLSSLAYTYIYIYTHIYIYIYIYTHFLIYFSSLLEKTEKRKQNSN